MDEKFEKWAKGYSGFDGGNPNGKIWLCGIEWGGKSPENLEELFEEDVSEIEKIVGYDDYIENLNHVYNKRFINIIGAIKDDNFPIETEEVKTNIFKLNEQEKFFTNDSNYLKLNLSPFNFSNTNTDKWNNDYIKLTGFTTKGEYEKWAWNQRYELFQKMTNSYQPKLRITFGNSKDKNYTKTFKKFFGFENQEIKVKHYKLNERLKQGVQYCYYNNILFINTYFPSNGWLVRPEDLKETGKIIRELLEEYEIDIIENKKNKLNEYTAI